MLRAIALATLVLGIPLAARGQEVSVLHIKVVLTDADGQATPVPRHALLISDNPATSTPRLVTTGADGTVDVKLRSGSYTVESDRPVMFHGKAYQWTQTLDVVRGRDARLELTLQNAEAVAGAAADAASAAAAETDPWVLLPPWQDSVVAVWTPLTRVSGFVVDAKGLIATTQRDIGSLTSVEVQLTPALKVAANVVASDADRDVAMLAIDPAAVASVRPVPLGCGQAAPAVANGQDIFAIGAPLRQLKGITPGSVTRVEPRGLVADLRLARGGAGGPVFAADGSVLGIASASDEKDDGSRGDVRVVRLGEVCEVVASAEKKMTTAAVPRGAHLPVEPALPFPEDALKDAAEHRAGSLNPYQVAGSTFDAAFITPVMIFGAEYQAAQMRNRARTSGTRMIDVSGPSRPLLDFRNWSDYVGDYPPVLLVRVTPKLAEGFWTTVARGAAQTQGVAIPPIKRPKSGFSRMQAFCGDAEVTPIHPFKLELRVSQNDTIYEGLYAFDPGALGPECASVKLVLYSEKEPDKADTRVVDPKIVQQIWQDFAPYRAQAR